MSVDKVIRPLFFLLFILFGISTYCQNTSLIPEIINFTKKTYEAGNQNRAIDQDSRGILYIANDDGVLVFDGSYWKTYPLPNKSVVRSLAVSRDTIYVGGQKEIGYFCFGKNEGLVYHSLRNLIPTGEEEFTDVWHVIPLGNDIFFHSNKRIFRYSHGKVSAWKSANWAYAGASRDKIFAQQYENGLMYFNDTGWTPYPNIKYDFTKDKVAIRSVSDFGTCKTLLTTLKSGVYLICANKIEKFETPAIASILPHIILSSCTIDSTLTAIGTKLNGYYTLDSNGIIKQHISKSEGLQTNNVNIVYTDRHKNIWLGLDNGLDLIVRSNPINHIIPGPEHKSPGYSAMAFNNRLYIGTGIALYSIPLSPGNNVEQSVITQVNNSSGIVWALSVVNDQLIMGRNDGAYLVENNNAVPLDTITGFWFFHPYGGQQPAHIMLAGTYNGINLYKYENGRFINPKPAIHTFFEAAKFTVVVDNDVWTVHPYQGLYKISLDKNGLLVNEPYKDVNGILSAGHNHLFKIRNKIVLVTRKGIFEYDKQLGDFKESVFLNKLFHDVSYLREDAEGNIWFIQDKRPGVVDLSTPDNPNIIYFSELNNSVLGNDEEFIYPINKNNILIGGEIGLYHIDYEQYKRIRRQVNVLLRSVSITHRRDSTIFGGYISSNIENKGDTWEFDHNINYKWNSLRFEFSSPSYGEMVEYSCRLKGYEEQWSDWTRKTEKSYANLPAGSYVFEVKARNTVGNQSVISQFSFTVSPPWYNTWYAYILYILAFASMMYLLYKYQKRKYQRQHALKLKKQQEEFEAEQKRLLYQHQLEIEKNEKEVMRLKNIKLEAEVQHNNTELASNTMSLLQKREILNKIKDEIIKVQHENDPDKITREYRRILKLIDEELDVNNDWERFSIYFDRVNNDFFRILNDSYPSLTQTDLRLCAYLRLNLSTKEIADLLNLSIRGVESSRYRLRKKLDLSNDLSLYDFLKSIGNAKQNGVGH